MSRLPALALFILAAALPQSVPFPATPVGGYTGNPTNGVTVGPNRPGGGGYSGDLVVAQCQWGPCSYNVRTGSIWRDVISCTECAGGGGGRYRSGLCDTHQGVSVVFASPSLSPGSDTYMAADNYSANAGGGVCNSGPVAQFYKITNGVPSFVWGADIPMQAFLGFVGSNAYFAQSPCIVANMAVPGSIQTGVRCPTVFDKWQTEDSQGRKWKAMSVPNGLQVFGTLASPTPTKTAPIPTPTPTAFVSPSPTWTQIPGTSTPTPQLICVTTTPRP